MMNITFVITVAMILLVIFLFYIIVKSVWKTVKFAFTALIVCAVIVNILIFADVNSFQTKFSSSSNIYLLADGTITAGFEQVLLKDYRPMNSTQIDALRTSYGQSDYESMIAGRYKMFIIKREAFSNLTVTRLGEVNLTREQAFSLIDSDSAREDYVRIVYPNALEKQRKLIAENMTSSDKEFKGLIFGAMLTDSMKQDPAFIFRKSRYGEVIVYPETIAFKTMRVLPAIYVDQMVK